MEKIKRRKIFLILVVLLTFIGTIILPIKIKADSGWDSDYDSGWDSDYDSGWDSDYDSGWDSDYDSGWDSDYDSGWDSDSSYHSSGSGTSSPALIIVAVIIIIIIIAISNIITNYIKRPNSGGNGKTSLTNYSNMDEDKIKEIDPNMNISEFKTRAFRIYKDLQIAWMNFDTDAIKKLTTDEIYNMYSSQLDTLKLKGQKNIMDNITLNDVTIINMEKTNDVITVSVYLNVSCYDYVINEKTNAIVRGTNKRKMNIEYILTFVKSATNSKNIEKCPNCGAPIDIISSSTCPYCDSVLVKNASDYVMSKKTCIRQKME